MRKLSESKEVILLTNDRANLQKAINEELNAKTVHQYVREMTNHPELLDLLNYTDELPTDEAVQPGKMSKRRPAIFEEYKSTNEIHAGVVTGKYHQGRLQVNRNNLNEARVETGSLSILIKGFHSINRAINGDVVAVELLPQEEWSTPSTRISNEAGDKKTAESTEEVEIGEKQPTGKVVGIIKKNRRSYCGSIAEDSEISNGANAVLFVPVDKTIPRIRFVTRQAQQLLTKRIMVDIDNWSVNSNYPDGHYVKTLGDIYDNDVESRVILIEHDIPHYSFSDTVLQCLPQNDWKVGDNIQGRRDLRGEYVMSVDPPGCTDIDDALHCKTLENGNLEIGVHIADVTHFVLEGSPLDEEAALRGTTVYLVDRRIEMLPKLLTNNLCSLISDVDRYAYSVLWEVTKEGEIVDVDFCKSVIRSRHSLTYEMAQNIIDDKNRNDQAAKSLRELGRIAKILRRKRMEAGALSLASPAVKFDIDRETLNPTDVEMYQLRETNALVEEYMLLANISVAKRILSEFPTLSCLRRHPHPNPTKFDQLLKTLHTLNVDLDISSSRALNDSLDKLSRTQDSYFDTLVRILVTRCMEQAVYFISGDLSPGEYMHYGLATPLYTHFTSPIRRYADIIVHRLLSCAIGLAPLSKRLTDRDLARNIVEGLNKRNRAAQYAERASVELYTNVFFANRFVENETAYVTRVRSNGLMVFVPRYGFEHLIKINEDACSYDDAKEALTVAGKTIKTFQQVKIKIFVHRSKNYRRQLVLHITEPNIMSALETKDLSANMLDQDIQEKENHTDDGDDVTLFEKSNVSEPKKKKRRTKK